MLNVYKWLEKMGKEDEQLHSKAACDLALNFTQCRGAMSQKLGQETRVQS